MAVKTEPNFLGDGIKWEESNDYSRQKVTVLSGQNLALLEVVGKVTASGKVVALDPAGVDGSEVAAGVMIAAVDATSADKTGVAIVREAMIAPANLVWPDGISAGDKATAIADLEKLGIVAVEIA
jgi:hypothetical protein